MIETIFDPETGKYSVEGEDDPVFVVCWMQKIGTGDQERISELWQPANSALDAQWEFAELCEDPNVYSASICAVVESTDYTPHPKFRQADLLEQARGIIDRMYAFVADNSEFDPESGRYTDPDVDALQMLAGSWLNKSDGPNS